MDTQTIGFLILMIGMMIYAVILFALGIHHKIGFMNQTYKRPQPKKKQGNGKNQKK